MENIKLGFISIIRTTFDVALASEITGQVRQQLDGAGFALRGPEAPVTTADEAADAVAALADEPLDLLLILQATFADSTMVMRLAQEIDCPVMLWAVPEAHTGGRLRLNSLCGVNLAAHALKRAGYTYGYLYAAPDDPDAIAKVNTYARAGRVRRVLRNTRIGRVGEHPAGFDTCKVDTIALQEQFGVEIVQVDLQKQVFTQVKRTLPILADTVAEGLAKRVQGLSEVDQQAARGTFGTYLALRNLAEREQLNGFAVRCWPEFFTELGCAACGSMSMLSDEMTPCSCEADVNGTLTQIILQNISGEPAFGSDIVSVDRERDALVLWHCGLAPLSMADPENIPGVTIHSNRKLPLLMEFTLKPGRVTIARLSEATGSYRLVIGGGEIVRAPKSFSGTSGLLKFDRPAAEILDTLLGEGLEHHLSITYGDHTAELHALALMLDLPVLEL